MQRVILPFFGDMEISDISTAFVEMFITSLYDQNLAVGTIKRYLAVFRSMMSKAVKVGLIAENPANSDRLERLTGEKQEIYIMTREHMFAFLDVLDNFASIRWRALIYFALDSGARRGEIIALRWSDLSGQEVHIQQAAYKTVGHIGIKRPKNGRDRKIYIASETAALLQQWQRVQKKNCLKKGASWSDRLYMFGNIGELMYPDTPTAWLRKFLNRYDLPPFRFHSLRHTAATQLLVNGLDLQTVAGRLGHRDIETTKFYLHCLDEIDQTAAEIVTEFLYHHP